MLQAFKPQTSRGTVSVSLITSQLSFGCEFRLYSCAVVGSFVIHFNMQRRVLSLDISYLVARLFKLFGLLSGITFTRQC